MRQTLERIMAQYGQTVTLARRDGTKRTLRAFVQPVTKQREALPIAATPLGAVSEELWVYIGPGDAPLSPGDSVEQGVLSLTAREVKALYWQDEVLYHWALLGRRKEAAT